MAIQITVCTPLFYFQEFRDCPRPKSEAKRFCRDVNAALGISLEPGESREFYFGSFPASDSCRISDLIDEHGGDRKRMLVDIMGADPHLPFEFDCPTRIPLPNYQPGEDAWVSSTMAFSSAIQEAEAILNRFSEGDERARSLDVLAIFRDAIRFAEQEKQPIFWIY